MNLKNSPDDAAAADDPDPPAPITAAPSVEHRRNQRPSPLSGAHLMMVLIMATVVGLMLGVVVLVELLT